METTQTPVRANGMGIASIVLGILGGVFYFWVPLGMVLGVAGLLTGVVGVVMTGPHSRGRGLLLAGILLSIVALCLDFYIADFGLELLRLRTSQ